MQQTRTAAFLIAILLLTDCEKERREIMQVSIKNDTDADIICDLQPTSFASGYLDQVDVSSGASAWITGSDNAATNVIQQINQAYKAITVTLENDILVFQPDKAPENYTLNPFTDTAAWQLTIYDENFVTNFKGDLVKIWDYAFTITEDNIIK